MAARINPVPLMALIICVILTLIFTVLVILKSGDVRRIEEGDPEKATFKSIVKLRDEVAEKQNKIKNALKGIELRKGELYRQDLQGNVRRLFYEEGELLGAVSTPSPGGDTAEVRGQQIKAKESSWQLTSDLIAKDVSYMDGLKAEYASDARQAFPQLDEAIKKRQDELKDVLKKISDQDATFQADKERLSTQLDQLTAERDKIDKKTRDDVGVRLSHINQLEEKIRELLELDLHWMVDRDPKTGKIIGKAGLDPDGTVVQADGQNLKVILDKGAKDHVFPGLLFEVFNYDRGAYVDKGKIEVIEVQEGISTARMLAQSDAKRNPIGAGDYVGNPVFDARKPKIFVVAGEFKHYNKEDLEAFVRRTGGIVWPALAPGVDFLVAGERSDHEQAAARQYQILAMKEDDLLDYVQTTFPPRADKAAGAPVAPPVAAAPAAAPAAGDAK